MSAITTMSAHTINMSHSQNNVWFVEGNKYISLNAHIIQVSAAREMLAPAI